MEDNYYAYFFTRQDILPEQQLVQTAHAALVLGATRSGDFPGRTQTHTPSFLAKASGLDDHDILKEQDIEISSRSVYFTCIGVRNVDALDAVINILQEFGYEYEVFYEPDINNEPTSIAVVPVHKDHRGPLLAFNLLKIGSKG